MMTTKSDARTNAILNIFNVNQNSHLICNASKKINLIIIMKFYLCYTVGSFLL